MRIGELLRRIWHRLNRDRFERELEREMVQHRAMMAEPRRFGNTLRLRELARDEWGWGPLDDFGHDLRDAFRQAGRSPGFSAIALVTLAFGIGANTTMFSLVNAILFQPLHASRPEQIVAVFSSVNPDAPYGSSSYPDYVDIRDRSTDIFQELSAYTLTTADWKAGEGAQHLSVGVISGNYFHLLGTDALLGRTFAADEDRLGDPRRVAILSERMWRERFGSEPGIVGTAIRLNAQSFTVVGVMDSRFCRLRHFFEVDLFIPAAAKDALSARPAAALRNNLMSHQPATSGQESLRSRRARQFFLLGRLADGSSLSQAQARLQVIASGLHQEHPETWSDDRGRPGTIRAVSERDSRVPPQARLGVIAFSVFVLGVVGTVLLIVCTNLASLSLARALSRRTELAVRIALGASRWRVVRQLLTDSLLLSLMGAAIAMVLTGWAVRLLDHYRLPMEIQIGLDLVIDQRVLVFTVFVTLATTVFFGLAPALHATGSDVVSALKDTGIPASYRRLSFRGALIAAEVALSIVLLVPSGLFLRSLHNFENFDLGFKRDHLVLVSVTLDPDRYSLQQGYLTYRTVADRLRRVPGVEEADFASEVPLSGTSNTRAFLDDTSGQARVVESNAVGPRYFDTLGIPFLRGHGFEGAGPDRPVAVVNEAFARMVWPNEDALGKHLFLQGALATPLEVIGVVPTGKYASAAESPTPYVYRPLVQDYSSSATFHIRTRLPPGELTSVLAREVHAYDASLPVFDVKTMEDQLALTVAPYQLVAVALGAFGLFALVIAFAGLYGLIAYQTVMRTREIGIRVALGASAGNILAIMVKEGLRLVLVGLAIGIPASLALALLIAKFLFGVAPLDVETYVVASSLMAVVAVTAIAIPAVRCMRIEPWAALRRPG